MVHEFGHFIFCKIFGIPAPKFSIGVGPTIVKKIYKGTEFILALIPIGGYTQIGMDPEKKERMYFYSEHFIHKGQKVRF